MARSFFFELLHWFALYSFLLQCHIECMTIYVNVNFNHLQSHRFPRSCSMKVLVPVKRVVDYNVKVRVKS
ncbi:hypothetical protein BMF29_05205, partial [Comamonas kerstersii]